MKIRTMGCMRRVHFQDCDPFRHLNNSKYLDYFLAAREEQVLEHYDWDLSKLAYESHRGWVVREHQIMYLQAAQIMEQVWIESHIIRLSKLDMTVEMRMWNSEKKVLKALLWTQYIFMDLERNRPVFHSEEFMTLFEEVLVEVEQPTLKARARFLSKKN